MNQSRRNLKWTSDEKVTNTMTPTTSPASSEKPFTEIRVGKRSPGSPDSNQNIKAVSDKMAIVRV